LADDSEQNKITKEREYFTIDVNSASGIINRPDAENVASMQSPVGAQPNDPAQPTHQRRKLLDETLQGGPGFLPGMNEQPRDPVERESQADLNGSATHLT